MADQSLLVTVSDLVLFADVIAWSVIGLAAAFAAFSGVVVYFALCRYVDARFEEEAKRG